MEIKAQLSPILGAPLSPLIEWKDMFWPATDMAGNPLSQEASSQDWHYDVIEYKMNGVVVGYLAAGFSNDQTFTTLTVEDPGSTVLDCYSKIALGDECHYFLADDETYGLPRQMLVFYDLDGNITNFFRYNLGEFWGVTQDDNEDIYLFGYGANARNLTESNEVSINNEPQLGTGSIYYNPNSTSQPVFPLACNTTEEFQGKANIVKINTSGTVIWNNYYGLPNTPALAHSLRGKLYSGIFKGDDLLAGGFSAAGAVGINKFLVSVNKTTGFVNWRKEFRPSSQGEIFEITKKGDEFLISGIDLPISPPTGGAVSQGFISKVSDNNLLLTESSFNIPDFYYVPGDIPTSIDPNGDISSSILGRSTSAIFTNTHIYWFIVANNIWNLGANAIADGVVVQIDLNGTMQAMDNFGEIRAFDLWVSGTPTDDGGFALITTRHTPAFFDTGTLPFLTTPMDINNPTGPTIGDCLLPEYANCDEITTPNSRFWELMSTCTYVRKYDATFNLEWDKIWDSSDNVTRECVPGNLKQQECVYRIRQSSVDGGYILCGNTSDNLDDSYLVKLANDCGLNDFYGKPTGPNLIVDYTDGIYDITTNTTWSTPKKVLGTVRIKPGVTLTILNTTVEFATGATVKSKIDVEQNGYLIVDGSTLTSGGDCDDFWNGISVWGDTDQHQYYDNATSGYYQGRLKIKNSSIIENAATAITNWQYNNWDERGGIIQVDSSTFRNCGRAIAFMSYQNFSPSSPTYNRPDRSYINNTDFIVNDNIPLDLNTYGLHAQITLWKTDRVSIKGSNFSNTTTVPQSEYRGKAIYSENANYLVREYCNDPGPPNINGCQNETRSTFTGWHKAIEATGSAAARPVTVTGSIFNKNLIGIELDATDYTQIYKNEFFMGEHPFPGNPLAENTNINHVGVYSKNVLHWSIEENEFYRASAAIYDGHGVVIHNSEGAENQVYNNEFNNLATGTDGWQVNRNVSPEGGAAAGMAGLQFICNTNTGNTVDFEMSRSGESDDFEFLNSGLRHNQGSNSPEHPAGNTFSVPDPDPYVYTHFKVSSDYPYKYYYHNEAPVYTEITPGTFVPPIYVSANKHCPANYTNGGFEPAPPIGLSEFAGKQAEFEGMQYTYNQLIDNGNTNGTVTEIELTWPQDAWQMRDNLIARSPYNSEDVLIAAIERNVMPHAMLLEVLLANPDALRSGNVIDEAKQTPNPPMPLYMIDLLNAAQNQTTMRTALEATLADLHLDVQRYQKKIILTHAFADSTYNAPDSTLFYLSKVKTVEGNYSRAAAMADRRLFAQAITLLDSMQITYKLSTERYSEMSGLKTYYAFLKSVSDDGRTIADLEQNEIADMKNIAEDANAGRAAVYAQNALCFHYNICYDAKGIPKSNIAPPKPKAAYNELIAELNTSTAYPNPADTYITIGFNFLLAHEQSELLVYDNLGKQILSRQVGKVYQGEELIDARKLPNGVYFYQLTQNGKKVSDGKFIVTH